MRIIYYDTETTGLKSETDRIVEIAGYESNSEESYSALINPQIPIPPESSRIHKISDEMVADAPSFAEIGEKFIEFCGEDAILIAHNNDNFDIHFLYAEFERHKLKMPSSWRFVDSLKWARRYRPDLPRHTLQYLREMYHFSANNAHRALDDVMVLKNVFMEMTRGLPMETVYNILQKEIKITNMPFGKYRGKKLNDVPGDYLQWLYDSGALNKAHNYKLRDALKERNLISDKEPSLI